MNMSDIASRAGVSHATVSRVVNGSPLVREQTAKRIRKILEEVNFVPNTVAKALKYGLSKTYGLIIPDIKNPFFSEFLAELEEVLAEIDHEILLTSMQSRETLARSVRRMLTRSVDGAVFMASEFDTQDIEPLFLHKVPLVTIDRRMVREGLSDVSIDYEKGYLEAVCHLKQLGHKRLGYIGGIEGLRTSKVRLDAFRAAVEQMGLRFYPNMVRSSDFKIPGGEQAAISLMSQKVCPTAIMTISDLTAFGAIRGLNNLGMHVPTDVSLVGQDDVLLSEVFQPPLTTVRIPRRHMAEVCVRALNYTKEDVERVGAYFTVPAELKVRKSTAPPQKHK